jgi:uncharacterized membrane protein YfcA
LNSYARFVQAFGGIVGSIMAAFLTQYTNPHYSFLIQAVLSLLIIYSGYILNKELDKDFEKTREASVWKEVKKNTKSIVYMFKHD